MHSRSRKLRELKSAHMQAQSYQHVKKCLSHLVYWINSWWRFELMALQIWVRLVHFAHHLEFQTLCFSAWGCNNWRHTSLHSCSRFVYYIMKAIAIAHMRSSSQSSTQNLFQNEYLFKRFQKKCCIFRFPNTDMHAHWYFTYILHISLRELQYLSKHNCALKHVQFRQNSFIKPTIRKLPQEFPEHDYGVSHLMRWNDFFFVFKYFFF